MICFHNPGYFVPLPPGHPFPISKYHDSYERLKSCELGFDFRKSPLADMADVLAVHSSEYLEQIRRGGLSKYASNRLGLPHHPRFFERSLLDVGGTIAASDVALDEGIAWNLGGGTHHAMRSEGLGFCVTNDVSIACVRLRKLYLNLQILILDTDAHQGNGNHAILADDPASFTYSIHVGRNYPAVKVPGDMDVELPRYASGEMYLDTFKKSLERLASVFEPDIVFWISGVDVHASDRFGQMKLSDNHMRERNRMVFDFVEQKEAVLVGTYGGGYHKNEIETARMHADCVRQSYEYFS